MLILVHTCTDFYCVLSKRIANFYFRGNATSLKRQNNSVVPQGQALKRRDCLDYRIQGMRCSIVLDT